MSQLVQWLFNAIEVTADKHGLIAADELHVAEDGVDSVTDGWLEFISTRDQVRHRVVVPANKRTHVRRGQDQGRIHQGGIRRNAFITEPPVIARAA